MYKLGRLRVIGAATAVGALGAPLAAQAAQRPIGKTMATAWTTGTVGHVGRWFTDSLGRVLIFHGPDLGTGQSGGNVDESPGAPFDPKADPAYIHSLGFNSAKMYVAWADIEPQAGIYDDKFLQKVKDTVQALWSQGVYTELDISGGAPWTNVNTGYYTIPGGDGTSIPDPTGVLSGGNGFPVNNQSSQNFWDNAPGPGGIGVQDRWDAMCEHFAAFFRDTPGIFGYSIINEPVPGNENQVASNDPEGDPRFDIDVLAPFYRKSFAAFRKADPTTLIHYEPDANFNLDYAPSWVPNLGDPNLVFDYHAYVDAMASAFSGLPPGSTRAQEAQVDADRNNAPAFNAERFFSAEGLDHLDQAMQGWDYFTYTHSGSASSNPLVQLGACPQQTPSGLNGAQGGFAACFVRPYPQAIAGTPTGWSFDTTTKTFTLNYNTTQPDGALGTAPTQLFLPHLVYTSGYSIALQGAKVIETSQHGQLVSIQAEAGATAVTITVTAK